jgi:hypothetical protein
MGNSQSRNEDAEMNEKLVERLRALQSKYDGAEHSEKEYIVVNGDARVLL